MRKTFTISLFAISFFIIFITLGGRAMATVGGSVYISDISYNPLNDLIYYIETDQSGRGCPPIIHGIDPLNKKDVPVKSCDTVSEEYNLTTLPNYNKYITDFYKDLTYLGSVSLNKNNINVTVNTLSEHIEEGEKFWTEFQAVISQDNKEAAKINFRGCDADQPQIFEGYKVPDTNLMALLISNKGDCFEGGYVTESLHLIDGIKYYDTSTIRNRKEASATEPNQGNITVYANTGDTIDKGTEVQKPGTGIRALSPLLILVVAILFLSGMIVGYLLRRRRT